MTLVNDAFYKEMRPSTFTYRGGRFRVVEVRDRWTEVGRWWENEPETTVWRVICHDGGMYELGKVHSEPPQWLLMVSHD